MKNKDIESEIKKLAEKTINKKIRQKIEEVVECELHAIIEGIVGEILEKKHKEMEKLVFPLIKDHLLQVVKTLDLKRPDVNVEINLCN